MMKKCLSISLASTFLLLTSCKKESIDSNVRSFTASNPATEGALLIRQVDNWGGGDSTVTSFQYNSDRRLTAVHSTGILPYDTYYYRDNQGRIIESINIEDNDSDIIHVSYASPSLGIISYAIEQSGPAFRDSSIYAYNQDHYPISITTYIISATPAQFGGIDSFSYDASGNLTQLQSFTSNGNGQLSLNIGYDFEYDNDINPLFSFDDSRLPVEWYTSVSSNNLLKQTNHYGNPPLRPDDDVTITYQYRPDKKPSTSARGGTALSTNGNPVVQSTYYYQ
jgi:hypothetical protein